MLVLTLPACEAHVVKSLKMVPSRWPVDSCHRGGDSLLAGNEIEMQLVPGHEFQARNLSWRCTSGAVGVGPS